MDVITAKELRLRFKKKWPELTQIWLRNANYVIPTLSDLEEITEQLPINLPIIEGFNECENFALFLHADVKKFWVSNYSIAFNWTFGDFICKKETLFFDNLIHTACLCLCAEGFYFIEPLENNKILKANNDYKPFFINLM